MAVLVADDLTGACDAGIEFAKRGLVARVGLGTVPSPFSDVLAVSTHTRDLDASCAAQRTASIAEQLPSDAAIVFRKIDSTLRGNVVSECDALMNSLGISFGVLAPSLPSQGRTVSKGILQIRDIAGARTMHIADLLKDQGASAAVLPTFDEPGLLRRAMQDAVRNGARYVICDAVREDHLHVIAQAAHRCEPRPLWIGSAGLAAQAAELLSSAIQPRVAPSSRWQHSQSPALFCLGSTHPVSEMQLAHLCAAHPVKVLDAAATTPDQLRSALSGSRIAVLRVHDAIVSKEQLTQFLRAALESGVGRILMSGGDTAETLCRLAQTEHLLLNGELLPGVAESIIHGGLLDGLLLATKSGGFGHEQCLSEILCAEPAATFHAAAKEDQ